jgi:ribosome-binding protein aMBF1 (putative translation factor)
LIKNERQYRITRAQAERFRQALREIGESRRPAHVHPKLWAAQRAGLESQLADLEQDLREYEALKTASTEVLEIESIEELPEALIRARIALGLTQKGLAKRLHVKPQQVQRYEASDYQTASFSRIRQVAKLLGLQLREPIELRLSSRQRA